MPNASSYDNVNDQDSNYWRHQQNIKDIRKEYENALQHQQNIKDIRKEYEAQISKDYFPKLNGKIRGLPPIGFNTAGGYEPMALSDSNIGNAQDTMFKNSFPILAIRAVELTTAPDNPSKVSTISPISEFYKFAIQNAGTTSYSITNEYGESEIESMFNNVVQSTSIISDLHQLSKNNRAMGHFLTGLRNISGVPEFMEALNQAGINPKELLNNAPNVTNDPSMKQFGALAGILGHTLIDTTLGGQKIDIPNVWKGSSGGATQSVKIVLHCYDTSDDNEYNFAIIQPLKAIMRLSAPYSESDTGYAGVNGSKNNDIITYENPPYIEAYLGSTFQTKLGAINSCNIDIPFDRISYYKNRPYIVNVSLTIVDMYNSLIYTNNPSYAPNVLDIINNLENSSAATSPNEQVSEVYSKNWLQEPNSTNAVGAIANAIASVGNAIGDIASTGGIVNNIAAAGANAISGIIKQVIPTSMSSIASNANELLNKTSNSLLKNAKKSMVNTVVSGVNKITSFF